MNRKIINCDNMVPLTNRLGTCWNLAILTILFYSDMVGPEVQNKLKLPKYVSKIDYATNLVNESQQQLREFLPDYINFDEKKFDIIILINYLIERFNNKIGIAKILENDKSDEPVVLKINIPLKRKISIKCEEQLTNYFFKIFNGTNKEGGTYYDEFFLLNLLSIILLHKKINIESSLTRDRCPTIIYSELNKPSLGFLIGNKEHAVGLFKCDNNYKFVDNENIINFDFDKLLKTIKDLDDLGESYTVLLDSNGLYIQNANTNYRFNDKYREDDDFMKSSEIIDFNNLSFYEEEDVDFKSRFNKEYDIETKLTQIIEDKNIEQFEIIIKKLKNINKLDKLFLNDMFKKLLDDYETNKGFIMIMIKYGFNNQIFIEEEERLPIEIASKMGYLDLVKLLLKNKVKIDESILFISLRLAIKNNHLEIVKVLLEGGVDPNYAMGQTPLMAASQIDIKMVDLLLEKGAKVDTTDRNGRTALHYAIISKKNNIIKRLIKNNADINFQNINKETPLIIAYKSKNYNAMVELLNAGADKNIPDKTNNNFIDYIRKTRLPDHPEKRKEIEKLLIMIEPTKDDKTKYLKNWNNENISLDDIFRKKYIKYKHKYLSLHLLTFKTPI